MFPLGHVPASVGPRVMPPVHDANVYPLDDNYANANENVRKYAHHGRDERTVRSLADEFSAVQMPGDMPRSRNAAGYQVDYREPQSVNAYPQENAQYGDQDVRADQTRKSSYYRKFVEPPVDGRFERSDVFRTYGLQGQQENKMGRDVTPMGQVPYNAYCYARAPPVTYNAVQQPVQYVQYAPVMPMKCCTCNANERKCHV